jgi:hypothetical protein
MRLSLLEDLLDAELAAIQASLDQSSSVRAWREGSDILVAFDADRNGAPGVFRLSCDQFDTEPPSVAMLDPQTRTELPHEHWTPGVSNGGHPLTSKPFVCLQGVAEYHSHPSHTNDSWDRYRYRFRLTQTVRRLLEKAGVTL